MAFNNTTSSITTNVIERNCVNGIRIFLSILGIIGNVIVVILIAKHRHLRKNCKYLQAALAGGDAILCLGQLTNAITNLIMINLSIRIIRWQCLILSTHGAMAIMYSMIMTVFIAFDRLIAITYPIRYRSLPKRRICQYCVCISLGVSLSLSIASYTDVDLFDYPIGCTGSGSRSRAMSGLINNFNAAAGIILLIVYPFTLLSISLNTKHFTNDSEPCQNTNAHYFFKQVQVTSSITCVIMSTLLIYVVPNLMVIILKSLNAQPLITSKAPAYIGLGSTIHSGVNCLFYFWKDSKMREAFCRLFSCGLPHVASVNNLAVTSSNSGQTRHQEMKIVDEI